MQLDVYVHYKEVKAFSSTRYQWYISETNIFHIKTKKLPASDPHASGWTERDSCENKGRRVTSTIELSN